jgi:hypothetical protein
MSAVSAQFEVRLADVRDGPRLAELDRIAFSNTGMGHYGEDRVRCWFEVNPKGLLVATRQSTVVAYAYSQYVDFSPDDLSTLTTDSAFTDSAFTRRTHLARGNSIHVVTVSSVVPGGRKALFRTLIDQLHAQNRRYLFLFSRVAGFSDYCHMLTSSGIDVEVFGLERVARSYVHHCAAKYGGHIWVGSNCEPLALPTPNTPDPVLNKYLKDDGARVISVLDNWLTDPASQNFSAIVAIQNRLERTRD